MRFYKNMIFFNGLTPPSAGCFMSLPGFEGRESIKIQVTYNEIKRHYFVSKRNIKNISLL